MKKLFKRLFNNKVFTVRSRSLGGVRMRLNGLISGNVFFTDYEPDKQKAISALMPPNGVFFDVGANIGLHSYFVNKHFPDARIFSFEPLPDNLAYLNETIQRNGIRNMNVVGAAVSASPGESFFDISNSNFKGKLSTEKTALRVKMITLDGFVQERQVWPDLIKVDVEGAEEEVLLGAGEMIKQCKPTFIIELHNPTQDIKVAALLRQHGYDIQRVNPQAHLAGQPAFLPIPDLNKAWPNPDGVWGNIVAVHPENKNNNSISL
jgi:FkbM family methyltransferase